MKLFFQQKTRLPEIFFVYLSIIIKTNKGYELHN